MRRNKPLPLVPLNTRQKAEIRKIAKRQVGLKQELKYFLINTYDYAISTTPSLFQLSAIPQGDTDTTRDGDRLELSKISLRGQVYCTDVTNIMRFIVFQFRPSAVPVASQILQIGPSGAIDVWSNYNHDTRQEYKILYDKTFTMQGNGAAATSPFTDSSYQHFQRKITNNNFNKNLQYIGGGTGGTNQIYYIAVSDSNLAAHPTITFQAYFNFKDS